MGILNDIVKRDLTGNKKIEDDLNHLDMEDLKDYINVNYNLKFNWQITAYGTMLQIPIIYTGKAVRNASYLQYSKNKDIKLYESVFDFAPDLKSALKEKFKTKTYEFYMHIYPNYDKVDNDFFIKVLDFIINKLGDRSLIDKK